MFYIESENYIYLTRGDTAYLTVNIKNTVLGEEYVMNENDELTLTVKENIEDKHHCLQKTLHGENTFKINPEDTADLNFGTYRYDVQLTTEDGEVYTIIGPSKFKILSEVTY